MKTRIGHGTDVHALTSGDGIILGGVKIPTETAFVAHSDGDVLIHALCDALLGALALGDMGQLFPDTDAAHADQDSRVFLRHIKRLIDDRGYSVGNADITIVAQQPKMTPHLQIMRQNLVEDLDTVVDKINIKATTTERLGFVGREEGIAVHAVVLLQAQS